jgi:hypothetical protein
MSKKKAAGFGLKHQQQLTEQTGTGGIAVKPFVGFVMYNKASGVPSVLKTEKRAARARSRGHQRFPGCSCVTGSHCAASMQCAAPSIRTAPVHADRCSEQSLLQTARCRQLERGCRVVQVMPSKRRRLDMKAYVKLFAPALLMLAAVPVTAQDRGDRINERLDERGERINERLDQRGLAAQARLDAKGDRVDARLDARAEHAEENGKTRRAEHLDARGDRVDQKLDARGQHRERRLDTKGDRIERRLDHRGNRLDRRIDRRRPRG